MASRWKGDEASQLPAAQVEPYRLWFEFLKLAMLDPDIEVDRTHYQPWGDVAAAKFNDWWPVHWRELFSVDIGVQVLNLSESVPSQLDRMLTVQIPLYQNPKQSLAQVKALLELYDASGRLEEMAEGQFRLSLGAGGSHFSVRFLKNISKVRLLLNVYRHWLRHAGQGDRSRLEATARSYFEWADGWNRNVKERQWKRTLIDIPPAIRSYVEYLDKRDASGRKRLSTIDDESDNRRQIARYIRKARKIALNVSQGTFPGSYD